MGNMESKSILPGGIAFGPCRSTSAEQEVVLLRKERDVAQANERAAAVEWKRSQDEVAALKKQLQKVGFELEDAHEKVLDLQGKLTLAKAGAEAAGSQMLDLQQECVAVRRSLAAAEMAGDALEHDRDEWRAKATESEGQVILLRAINETLRAEREAFALDVGELRAKLAGRT